MRIAKRVSMIAVAILCAAAVFLLVGCNPVSSFEKGWDKATDKTAVDTISIPKLDVGGLITVNGIKVDIERKYTGSKIDFKVQVGYKSIVGLIMSVGVLPPETKNMLMGAKEKAVYVEGSYNVETDEVSVAAHAYFPDDSNPENRIESGKLSDMISTFTSQNGLSAESLNALADHLRGRYDLLAVYKFNEKLEKKEDVLSGKFDPLKDDGLNDIINLLKPFVNDLMNSNIIPVKYRDIINAVTGDKNLLDFALERLEFKNVSATLNIKDKKIADMKLTQKINGNIEKEVISAALNSLGDVGIPDILINSVLGNGINITMEIESSSVYTY